MSFFSLVHVHPDAMNGKEGRAEWHRLNLAGSAYRDHCLVWKLFPKDSSRAEYEDGGQGSEASFVFRRRDQAPRDPSTGGRASLSFYVVSDRRPTPVSGMLLLPDPPKFYEPALLTGETVRFQLRANPSVARKRPGENPVTGKPLRSAVDDVLMQAKLAARSERPGDRKSSREQLRAQSGHMDAAAAAWLTQRAPRWGLQVEPDHLFADAYTQHRLRGKGRNICFSSLDYAGVATVTDPTLLRKALLEGVGRKRAFGCGLLLVRRLV